MKKWITLLAFVVAGIGMSAQSKLLNKRLTATITQQTMDSLLKVQHVPARLAPVRFDVEVWDVEYQTRWIDGTPIMASGLVMLPKGWQEAMPIVAYAHGTRLHRAREYKLGGEEAICTYLAADGYAVVMPDYIGLGTGEKGHLYHHAQTEATSMIDLVKTVKEMLVTNGASHSGQLFLTGYSQGGHAAMATHQYLQMHPEEGLKVTASAPMSGAYDLAGVQSEVIGKPYEHPGYLPYILLSFQAAYHLLPDSAAYFKAPYDAVIPPLFDGVHKFRDVNKQLPAVPESVLKDELLAAYKNDPENPMRKAMQANTLIHWAPEAPVLMCYCKADEQVLYKNALVARDTMRALGSTVVHTRMAGKRMNHGPCALYAAVYTRMWFDSFRDGSKKGKQGPAWDRFLLRLSRMMWKKPKPNKTKS
jgi:pimeloyl-ACP methyl ester carboxylesterase